MAAQAVVIKNKRDDIPGGDVHQDNRGSQDEARADGPPGAQPVPQYGTTSEVREGEHVAGRDLPGKDEEEAKEDTWHGLEEGGEGFDVDVLTEIQGKVMEENERYENYRNLLSFLLFTGLYCAVLYLQADSFRSFQVSTAHYVLLPEGMTGNEPFTFASPSDVYTWLNDSIIQRVWQDPTCGNGICERPLEFPGFGSFGCSQDCGLLAAVTQVTVHIVADFESMTHVAVSDWNLCMTHPVELCWFSSPTTKLELAAGGGVNLLRFGNCFADKLQSQLGQCRKTCATLAGCRVWQDPTCGNGICERPLEFPGFGSFGCSQDCGLLAAVTQVTVHIVADFESMTHVAVSDWNLCMTHPVELCWFSSPVTFTSLTTDATYALSIPDGDWQIQLNAPFGGVVGTVTEFQTTKLELAAGGGVNLLRFGNCFADKLQSQLGQCRKTCATLAGCVRKFCQGLGAKQVLQIAASDSQADFAGQECTLTSEALALLPANLRPPAGPPAPSRRKVLNLKEEKEGEEGQGGGGGGGGEGAYNPHVGIDAAAYTPSGSAYFAATLAGSWPHGPPAPALALTPTSTSTSNANPAAKAAAAAAASAPSSEVVDGVNLAAGSNGSLPAETVTISLWELLGGTDVGRRYNLETATARAIYTMMGHACLASTAITPRMGPRLVAFLCTWLGGPHDLEGCNYTHPVTGRQLTRDAELLAEMHRIHSPYVIGVDLEWFFIVIFEEALASTVLIDPTSMGVVDRRLRILDPHIANTFATTCNTPAVTLPWKLNVAYTSTIQEGQSIMWVWEDNEPHSIKALGVGETTGEPYLGMGAGRLSVSRNIPCTSFNRGNSPVTGEPIPCVLPVPYATTNIFAYTKQFKTAGVYNYSDSRYGSLMTGTVYVRPRANASSFPIPAAAANVASGGEDGMATCAPGCSLEMLNNGFCDIACRNEACVFDGGDCACSPDEFGLAQCSCPSGQTRGDDGVCCEGESIGTGLNFKFELRTYGPNASLTDQGFVPNEDIALERLLAEHNRVVIGMLIYTSRWSSRSCKDDRFRSLYPYCIKGTTSQPFGTNPIFLPTSELFNPNAAKGVTFNDSGKGDRNSIGLPFGFYHQPSSAIKDGYAMVLDINLNNAEATSRLQYLVDGFFLDNGTRQMFVQLITYNGDARKFTNARIELTFQVGGNIAATYSISSLSVELYASSRDWLRFALEVLFVAGVLYNVKEEALEMMDAKRRTGKYSNHFTTLANYIDAVSMAIQLGGIFLWLYLAVFQARPFSIRPRYDMYDDLHSTAQYWQLAAPPDGYNDAVGKFVAMQAMIRLLSIYLAMQGINIFLMVLRILKMMDFQPRMGIITRTLATAAPELVHFAILWLIIFMGYCTFGHLVFGRTIDQFRTLASSMVACFYLMLTDDAINFYLMQLNGLELVAGVIFFWSYVLFVVYVLLNIVIAIIVDAFMEVKAAADMAPLMPEELMFTFRNFGRQLLGPFRSDRRLLRYLRHLGARHQSLSSLDKKKEQTLSDKLLGMGAHDDTLLGCIAGKQGGEEEEEEELVKEARQVDDTPDTVLLVKDKEVDLETLTAVLQRSHQRQARRKQLQQHAHAHPHAHSHADPHAPVKGERVDSNEAARVLLQQYGGLSVMKQPAFLQRKKQTDIMKEMLEAVNSTLASVDEKLTQALMQTAQISELSREVGALRAELLSLRKDSNPSR
eukprot:jgi/Mesen1/6002/ME000306S05267